MAIGQDETKEFLETSRGFCRFIESTDSSKMEFMNELRGLLLILYLRATLIPWTTLDFNEEFDVRVSKEESENIIRRIDTKIGEERFYWTVFDPTEGKDIEPVCGDLVDDIADTYKDIKQGLMTYDLNTMASKEHGMWSLKFSFEKHWGQHAIDALRSLHFLLAK